MQPHLRSLIRKFLYAKNIGLFHHSLMTAEMAATVVLSAKQQKLPLPFSVHEAYDCGLLHDIGKVYIPDAILEKREGLSAREWETMRFHTIWGEMFVQGTPLEPYGPVILQHHEKPDGTGYPHGLKLHDILPLARVIRLADEVTALLEDRPYRRGIPDQQIITSLIGKSISTLFGSRGEEIVEQAVTLYVKRAKNRHFEIGGDFAYYINRMPD